MASREALVSELRELAGCANLTAADLGELRWETKQRVFLTLLAELPEGKAAVMACAQLRMERNRARQLNKAANALPEAARRAEDQLRRAFYAEMGALLSSMGAVPALRAPKKLREDAGACLRAIAFLAARVRSHRRRGSAPAAPSTPASKSAVDAPRLSLNSSSNDTSRNGDVERWETIESDTVLRSGEEPFLRRAGLTTAQTPRPSYRRHRSFSFPSSNEAAGTGVHTVEAMAATATAGLSRSKNIGTRGKLVLNRTVATFGAEAAKDVRRDKEGSKRYEGYAVQVTNTSAVTTMSDVPRASSVGDGEDCGDALTDPCARSDSDNRDGITDAGGEKDADQEDRNVQRWPPPSVRPQSASGGRNASISRGKLTGIGGSGSGGNGGDRGKNISQASLSFVSAAAEATDHDESIQHELEGTSQRTRTRTGSSKRRTRGMEGGVDNTGNVDGIDGHKRCGDGRGDMSLIHAFDDASMDAVGLEMNTVGGVSCGGGKESRRRSAQKSEKPQPVTPPESNTHELMAENARLRQRVEELQELFDSQSRATATASTTTAASVSSRGSGLRRGGRRGDSPATGAMPGAAAATAAATSAAAAASDAILRGQVAQLRRQVRLQWCAVDASSAVVQEVKAVLTHLEAILGEVASLGHTEHQHEDQQRHQQKAVPFRTVTPSYGSNAFYGGESIRATTASAAGWKREGVGFGALAGGVANEGTIPAWNQLLGRVQTLTRQLQWAERATQRAADGRIHVTKDSGSFLQPHANRGQRRPRDLRARALDPDHFTCPPPTHGAVHQQHPGATPAEQHASVIAETPLGRALMSPESRSRMSTPLPPPLSRTPGSTKRRGGSGEGVKSMGEGARGCAEGKRPAAVGAAAAGAALAAGMARDEAAAMATAGPSDVPGAVAGMHEMYHLDAASLGGFEQAIAVALRALDALLFSLGTSSGVSDSGGYTDEDSVGGRRTRNASSSTAPVSAAMETNAVLPPPGVASLLLGAGEIGGGSHGGAFIVEAIADIRDSFRELIIAAAAFGVVVPCAPDGAGAASADSASPSLRLLRGIRAQGGVDGARRLEALARRLPEERAALEAVAAAGVAEAREWRAAAMKQAAAVLSLGQGLRGAWHAHIRRTCAHSRSFKAILGAVQHLLSSPESAPILRGAAGPLAASLLQTLGLFQPELEEVVEGASSHVRRSEERVSMLWEAFEEACWKNGGTGLPNSGDDEKGIESGGRPECEESDEASPKIFTVFSGSHDDGVTPFVEGVLGATGRTTGTVESRRGTGGSLARPGMLSSMEKNDNNVSVDEAVLRHARKPWVD